MEQIWKKNNARRINIAIMFHRKQLICYEFLIKARLVNKQFIVNGCCWTLAKVIEYCKAIEIWYFLCFYYWLHRSCNDHARKDKRSASLSNIIHRPFRLVIALSRWARFEWTIQFCNGYSCGFWIFKTISSKTFTSIFQWHHRLVTTSSFNTKTAFLPDTLLVRLGGVAKVQLQSCS